MALAVLSYPELNLKDYQIIQDYRAQNDIYYSVIEPHFTFVFPVFDISQNEFIEEAEKKLTGLKKFDFSIRCATINKDAESDLFHVLLVPDEGFSQIVKIHDKLYSGRFRSNHRLDIDFTPHMAIANSPDRYKCKDMVDFWNSKEFCFRGSISKMTIIRFENTVVTPLQEVELAQ
jgi:hypothetical protein